MKSKFIVLLAILFLPQSIFAQTKKALIVAIAKFDDKGWRILGSMNDYELLNTTLQKQGFDKQNITLLSGEKSNKADIVTGLRNFTATLTTGDIVVLEFSTHGAQIQDVSGDEVDGLDEVIVCKNSPITLDNSNLANAKNLYLLDDEMGDIVNNIRTKIGSKGDLLMLMDFCHSGSSTRGGQDLVARGGLSPIVSSSFKPTGKLDDDQSKIESLASRGNADMSPLTVISAARSNQLDYERMFNNKSVGALTYGIVTAFESKITKDYTYRSLFADVQSAIQEKGMQNPVIESSIEEKVILGGAVIPQEDFFEISNEIEANKQYEIKGGTLNDLNIGSEVVFCIKGTNKPDSKNTIAKGEVISADAFKSIVQLSNTSSKEDLSNSWLFITKKNLSFEKIGVNFITNKARGAANDQTFSTAELKQLKAQLEKMNFVNIAEQPDLLIAKNSGGYDLYFNYGLDLFAKCGSNDLEKALSNYSKYCTMKKLELANPYTKVDVKIFKKVNGVTSKEEADRLHGSYVLKNGITYSMIVTNKVTKDLYVNLVYLDKSGAIQTVLPEKNGSVEECIVTKDNPLNISITMSPPLGIETFKLVVSDAKVDMRKIDTDNHFTRGADASLNDLENLFGEINNENTRGATATLSSDVMMSVGNIILVTQE